MILAEAIQLSPGEIGLILMFLVVFALGAAAVAAALTLAVGAATRAALGRPWRPARPVVTVLVGGAVATFGVFALWPYGIVAPVVVGVASGFADPGSPTTFADRRDRRRAARQDRHDRRDRQDGPGPWS